MAFLSSWIVRLYPCDMERVKGDEPEAYIMPIKSLLSEGEMEPMFEPATSLSTSGV